MKTDLKIAHKNDGFIKLNSSEESQLYEALKKLPRPLKEFNLSKDQTIAWYWFGKEFLKTHIFSKLDLIHLQEAAFWLDARNKNIAKINNLNMNDPDGVRGYVQVFQNNTNNVTGYLTAVEKADKHLADISEHFGLSFKDRQKLKGQGATDPNQLDMFSNFLEMQKVN